MVANAPIPPCDVTAEYRATKQIFLLLLLLLLKMQVLSPPETVNADDTNIFLLTVADILLLNAIPIE